jgi:hypothetical protein
MAAQKLLIFRALHQSAHDITSDDNAIHVFNFINFPFIQGHHQTRWITSQQQTGTRWRYYELQMGFHTQLKPE